MCNDGSTGVSLSISGECRSKIVLLVLSSLILDTHRCCCDFSAFSMMILDLPRILSFLFFRMVSLWGELWWCRFLGGTILCTIGLWICFYMGRHLELSMKMHVSSSRCSMLNLLILLSILPNPPSLEDGGGALVDFHHGSTSLFEN